MEYNTERKQLIIPEYGRHVQQMVDHCLTIEDKEERNEFARVIIDVLGNLHPYLRDVEDFQHKLWDQLYIMSNYKLDIDSPYPIPDPEEAHSKPNPIPYSTGRVKYRYYGKNIGKMIDVALTWEGDKKEGLILAIANHMKKCYLMWNKDTVNDRTIFGHLYELSDGKIDLRNSEEELTSGDHIHTHSSSSRTHSKKRKRRKKHK